LSLGEIKSQENVKKEHKIGGAYSKVGTKNA